MRYVPLMLLVTVLGACLVSAEDTSGNDGIEGAQKVTEEEFTGNLHPDTDPDDWFIVEVPPHTWVEITVVLETLREDHRITVEALDEDRGRVPALNMSIDTDDVKDQGRYLNDGGTTEDIHVHLSGMGSYRFGIFYEKEFAGGCFSHIYVMVGSLLVSVILLIFVLRKSGV
ncbi:MAG: hypothetical protein R6V01_09925 [Thermoplasmatota archaeon]